MSYTAGLRDNLDKQNSKNFKASDPSYSNLLSIRRSFYQSFRLQSESTFVVQCKNQFAGSRFPYEPDVSRATIQANNHLAAIFPKTKIAELSIATLL